MAQRILRSAWGTGQAAALALAAGAAVAGAEYRPIDGSGNNLVHTTWGAAETRLMRYMPSEYGGTGAWEIGGENRPNPRLVSQTLFDQPYAVFNARGLTDMVWQWGQFLDHDLDLSPDNSGEPMEIAVPAGDPWFDPKATGAVSMHTERSKYDPATGDNPNNPREQMNVLTAFIDASNVYGSDDARAAWLRSGVGGKLKVWAHASGDLMPLNDGTQENAGGASTSFFVAGDIRANEQAGLAAMHTLWVREHNRLCDEILAARPDLAGDDEGVYQRARAIVGALMQAITYNEFLPALLGDGAVPPYTGYNPAADPTIANEFSTALYRVGHTMLSSEILRLDESFQTIPDGNMHLRDAFFAPERITDEGGIEPILRGLAFPVMQEVDTQIIDDVRNMLFGAPGAGGLDLVSLNIQRGRDHGLCDYNAVRVGLGLAPVADWSEVIADPIIAGAFASVYPDLDDVDLWPAALAEDHAPGASVGPTILAGLVDQFTRVRDGDRFFYLNPADPADLAGTLADLGMTLADLHATTLGDVINRATAIDNVHSYVFHQRIPGDVDGDGAVGFDDLQTVLTNYGTPGGVLDGDADLDGMVGFSDLMMVLVDFGRSI